MIQSYFTLKLVSLCCFSVTAKKLNDFRNLGRNSTKSTASLLYGLFSILGRTFHLAAILVSVCSWDQERWKKQDKVPQPLSLPNSAFVSTGWQLLQNGHSNEVYFQIFHSKNTFYHFADVSDDFRAKKICEGRLSVLLLCLIKTLYFDTDHQALLYVFWISARDTRVLNLYNIFYNWKAKGCEGARQEWKGNMNWETVQLHVTEYLAKFPALVCLYLIDYRLSQLSQIWKVAKIRYHSWPANAWNVYWKSGRENTERHVEIQTLWKTAL